MTTTEIKQSLIRALESMEIVDAHEHLGPEKARLAASVDVFTLFAHYTRGDLRVAGMSEEGYQSLFNQNIPLERRWAIFAPYWEQIRWGSYARAALLAAKRFYGFDDINAQTYQPLSEAMRAANTPGIYDRVLRQACNIRVSLTQCRLTQLDSPLLVSVMPISFEMESWEAISRPWMEPEATVRTLDDYVDVIRRYIKRVKGEGAVGLKLMSNPYQAPSRKEALAAFERARDHNEKLAQPNPLRDYVVDEAVRYATQLDMVIAVHTGYWGDFRLLDPLHMIPILQRHPNTRFDMYHLGYPWVRESLMLGKGFPNVWLNFCWTHIISQRFATEALDEAIDLVPMNKLLAFGGDYNLPVEKVYGHLVMAREDIATVLAGRIASGQMSESQALELAKKWLWDNPKELYRLAI
jgi:predicted TIM-barrel fold metal-dependent hydrolase